MEKTYGSDVVKEALKKAYENKTESAFKDFDKNSKNIDKELKEDLERASPEKGVEANKAVREFQDLAKTFKNTLKEKAEELKSKGVDFNPNYIQNYGGDYEKYATLGDYDQDNQLIEEVMRNSQTYPPKLNFDALKEYTEKRIGHIKELTEDIKKLETEEDVNMFTSGDKDGNRYEPRRESGIGRAHKNILYTKFEGVKRPGYYENEQSWNQTKVKGLMQFKSYDEASTYFNEKDLDRKNLKERIVETIATGIETYMKGKELRKEIETQKFGRDIGSIENEVSRLEKNKKEALNLMTELIKIETQLPNEDVILSGNQIKVPSIGEELDQLKKDKETEEQNLNNLKQKISNHESNKPKSYLGVEFGIEKWKTSLTDLKQEQKTLEDKIKKNDEDYSALSKNYSFRIPAPEYSDIETIVEEQYLQANSKEIFFNLKNQLTEVINQKAPESVLRLDKEYKDLKKSLS